LKIAKFYFLSITLFTNCPISLGEILFRIKTTAIATAMEINSNSSGWKLAINPNICPDPTPAVTAIQEITIYFIDVRSDQIIDSIDELTNAASVEKAAPSVPKLGTKKKKANRNIRISADPIDISFFGLFRLLNLDIAFIVIDEGKMAIERISNIVSADTYCVPMMESTNLGEVINAATNGAVKVKPILVLVEDKSVPEIADAGRTMYAIFKAKPPVATILTINAT
jgi:hypothetical protein